MKAASNCFTNVSTNFITLAGFTLTPSAHATIKTKVNALSNPEAFQFEAAAILATAYNQFPLPFDWRLAANDDYYPTTTGASKTVIQHETIRWLKEQGYVRGKGLVNEHGGLSYWQAVQLTERGLDALNSVPDVLQGKEPLGKRLGTAVASRSFDLIKTLIPMAIQYALPSGGGGSVPA